MSGGSVGANSQLTLDDVRAKTAEFEAARVESVRIGWQKRFCRLAGVTREEVGRDGRRKLKRFCCQKQGLAID